MAIVPYCRIPQPPPHYFTVFICIMYRFSEISLSLFVLFIVEWREGEIRGCEEEEGEVGGRRDAGGRRGEKN